MKQDTTRTHHLANGMTLIAEPIDRLRSTAMTFLVPAGTVFEPIDKGGLAGFACEMILRGAGERDNREMILAFDSLGVERSESVGPSHIGFSAVALEDRLDELLPMMADMLIRPRLPESDFELARQIMFQELAALEDEPGQKSLVELRRTFFTDPWGRPNQGNRAGIENVAIDDVRDYWQNHFGPEGVILGVAGRFDWDRLREMVENLFGDWRLRSEPFLPQKVSPPALHHIPFDSGQTHIRVAFETVPYSDENYFEARGAIGILGTGMGSRLGTEMRERRGLCYFADASHYSLRERAAVIASVGTGADRAAESLSILLGELNRLGDGVTDEELARFKSQIKSALIMQQESSSSRASAVALDWYHLGRVRPIEEVSERIDRLSAERINRFLSVHRPGNFTILTLGSEPLEMTDAI